MSYGWLQCDRLWSKTGTKFSIYSCSCTIINLGAGIGTKVQVPVFFVKLQFFVAYILVKTGTKYYESTVMKS